MACTCRYQEGAFVDTDEVSWHASRLQHPSGRGLLHAVEVSQAQKVSNMADRAAASALVKQRVLVMGWQKYTWYSGSTIPVAVAECLSFGTRGAVLVWFAVIVPIIVVVITG